MLTGVLNPHLNAAGLSRRLPDTQQVEESLAVEESLTVEKNLRVQEYEEDSTIWILHARRCSFSRKTERLSIRQCSFG